MRSASPFDPVRLSLKVTLALGALVLAPAGASAQRAVGEKDVGSLWAKGCNAIVRGDFSSGAAFVEKYLSARPNEADAKRVSEWLGDQTELDELRNELRAQDYERHVAKAEKYREKDKAHEALIKLALAFINAEDQDAFREEGWVKQIVADAEAAAEKEMKEGDWSEARGFYRELSLIYPKNKNYKELLENCHRRVRLEAVYSPKSEWENAMRGITRGMVEDALVRIEQSYVEEPDFKEATQQAISNLLQVAECDPLEKAFESLKDPILREEFAIRLDARLKLVKGMPKVSREAAQKNFDRVLEINQETLRLPQEVVIAEYADGLLSSLDKFTSMIWPSEVPEFKKHTVGEFFGVGIQIHLKDGMLTVVSPLEDTPAYRAHIQADDVIVKIDGKNTAGITLNQAVSSITGPEGTPVVLTIRRPGVKKEWDVTISRARIKIQTVKGAKRDAETKKWDFMYDPENRIGYIRITSFMENTVDELREALAQLHQEGLRGLIVDLRFNPGGLLRSAVETADLFLPANLPIVSTKGRASEPWGPVPSRGRDSYPNLPMIVLVNNYSASASEIVSGALKDHNRALILGERTFGKGSVQNLIQLENNTAYLKLTTALYYLPDGESIHRINEEAKTWGVEPNIDIAVLPQEVQKVIEMRREADIIRESDAIEEAQAELAPAAEKDDARPEKKEPADEKDASERPAKPKAGDTDADPAAGPGKDAVADADKPKDDQEAKEEADEKEDPDAAEAAADLEEEREALERWPKVDPQLEAALLIMRVRLLTNQPWNSARADAG